MLQRLLSASCGNGGAVYRPVGDFRERPLVEEPSDDAERGLDSGEISAGSGGDEEELEITERGPDHRPLARRRSDMPSGTNGVSSNKRLCCNRLVRPDLRTERVEERGVDRSFRERRRRLVCVDCGVSRNSARLCD